MQLNEYTIKRSITSKMTNLGSNMTIKRSITSKMTNLGSNMTILNEALLLK